MSDLIGADAAKLAGLQIDMLGKYRAGQLSLPHLERFLTLSPEAREERFGDGKKPKERKKLFELLEDVPVEPTLIFDVSGHFLHGAARAGIRISSVGKGFKEYFGDLVERENEAVELHTASLLETAGSVALLNELGGYKTVKLSQMWRMLQRQGKGEQGCLKANGLYNLFLVGDYEMFTRIVWAFWSFKNGGGWDIDAGPMKSRFRWYQGTKIIFA